MDEDASTNPFTVQDAQQWYELNQPANPSISPTSGQKVIIKSSEITIKNYWEKAKVYQNGRQTVVEVPLLSQGMFGFTTCNFGKDELKTAQKQLNSLTRLVVIHEPNGSTNCHLMTFVPDSAYMVKVGYDLQANTYLAKIKDYTGMVLFHDPIGTFASGWSYQNGTITGIISQSNESKSKGITKIVLQNCTTYTVYYYQQDCTEWYVNGISSWITCGPWYTTMADSYTICPYIDPNDGGGTTSRNDPIRLLTPAERSKLNQLKTALLNGYCPNKNVVNGVWSSLVFKIDVNLPNPANYNPSTNTITFKDSESIIDFNLIEELFHAYQNSIYDGGILQYSLGKPGNTNIEFEAKLYKDLYLLYYMNETQNQQPLSGSIGFPEAERDKYNMWLFDIYEQGLTPALLGRYNEMLSYFNQYSPYKGHLLITLNAQPAIINSKSGCN